MNIEQYIPERVKKYIKIFYDPVQQWLFHRRYDREDTLLMSVGDVDISFDTSHRLSKDWFYPRYEGDQIHEPAATEYLTDIVESGDVFFDIGANVGYFSVVAAANGAESHAFEIDPRLCSIIYANLERNSKRYNVVVGAVTDNTDGICSFTPHQPGNPSTNQMTNSGEGFCIPTLSLDYYVQQREIVPNVVKIDVEGAEDRVIAGGHNTFTRDELRTILLEIHPDLLDDAERTIERIIDSLTRRGFDYYSFRDHRSDHSDTAIVEVNRSEVQHSNSNQMLLFSRE